VAAARRTSQAVARWQSEAIRGNQRQSEAINDTHQSSRRPLARAWVGRLMRP
jgi:hypothetical protein